MSAPRVDHSMNDGQIHLRWPAERFYWVLIREPHNVHLGGPSGERVSLTAGLTEQIAESIPIDATLCHSTLVDVPGVGTLACVALCADLDTLDDQAQTLRPASVPSHLREVVPSGVIDQLNLLHGIYEPRVVRRARSAVTAAGLWCAAAVLGLATLGFQVRAWTAARASIRLWESRIQIAGQALEQHPAEFLMPGRFEKHLSQVGVPTDFPVRLDAAYAALLRERGDAIRTQLPEDAGESLQDVLRAWPRTLETRIESLSVGESTVRFVGSVTSLDDASKFTEAMRKVPGWSLEQPQVSMAGDRVTVRAALVRVDRDAPAQPKAAASPPFHAIDLARVVATSGAVQRSQSEMHAGGGR